MENGSPQITTIIPTHCRPQLLQRAIKSALAQSFCNIRVAVYDNASNDETAAVVQELAKVDMRVTYHCHNVNLGAMKNFNYGIKHVTTPYFSVLSDDDLLLPDFYEKALEGFRTYQAAEFFCSRTVLYDLSRKRFYHRNQTWKGGFYEPVADNVAHMIRDCFISTGTVFSASLRDRIGEFDELGTDYTYIVKAVGNTPFIVVEDECAVLTISPTSFSSGIFGSSKFTERSEHYLGAVAQGMNSDYIKGVQCSLISTVLALPCVDAATRNQLFNTVVRTTRNMLLMRCLNRSIPENNPEELEDILEFLAVVRLPPGYRFMLKNIASLMRRSEQVSRSAVPLLRTLLLLRTKLKGATEARSGMTPCLSDVDLLNFIDGFGTERPADEQKISEQMRSS